MRFQILLILLAACLASSVFADDNDNTFTLYLVRHAEKQSDETRDPELTKAGKDRAQKLTHWLQNKDIRNIWSTDYKRTRGTAKPLVEELGRNLDIYDPGSLPSLAKQLRDNSNNAFVVGHSNTTPELARLLCKCSIADMDESEYDRLIEISFEDEKAHARILNQGDLFKR